MMSASSRRASPGTSVPLRITRCDSRFRSNSSSKPFTVRDPSTRTSRRGFRNVTITRRAFGFLAIAARHELDRLDGHVSPAPEDLSRHQFFVLAEDLLDGRPAEHEHSDELPERTRSADALTQRLAADEQTGAQVRGNFGHVRYGEFRRTSSPSFPTACRGRRTTTAGPSSRLRRRSSGCASCRAPCSARRPETPGACPPDRHG